MDYCIDCAHQDLRDHPATFKVEWSGLGNGVQDSKEFLCDEHVLYVVEYFLEEDRGWTSIQVARLREQTGLPLTSD